MTSKTTAETQVVEKTNDKTKTDLEKDRQVETTVTEITLPNGTKEKVTKTTENDVTKKKTDAEKKDAISTDTTTTSSSSRGSQVTVAALVGTSLHLGAPTYGGIVTRPILGPVTVGIWGVTPGVFGLAIGLTF